MKTLVSALALGLVLAFSAPAFASTNGAYVGDMIGSKPAPKASKPGRVHARYKHAPALAPRSRT